MKQWQTIKMPLSQLRPADYNPREISDRSLLGLERSISRFGIVQPIVWNKRTGNVVGGHQRLKVLLEKGETETDVMVVDLDDNEEVALNITLNNPEIQGTFSDNVGELLKQLNSNSKDLFDELQMLDLTDGLNVKLREYGNSDPQEEFSRIVQSFPVVPGQLWSLGRHCVYCGDCMSQETRLKIMGDTKIDLLLTDPPYGINEKTKRATSKRGALADSYDFQPIINDDHSFDPTIFLSFPNVILWGANYYANKLPTMGSWLIWDKREDVLPDDNADCEIAWCNDNRPARIFHYLWKGAIKRGEHDRRLHPTQKPVALMEWNLQRFPNAITVFDPFAGSGSTVLACESQNKTCFACDIVPDYISVILYRWQKFTGGTPKLIMENT